MPLQGHVLAVPGVLCKPSGLQPTDDSVVPVTQQTPVTDISYASLNLPDALFRGIADAGFERCTPIQAGTLPRALAGLDVAGQAQTGTGKTAAFLVAMFAQLLRHPASAEKPLTSPRGFILAPTRELAVQIHRDAELLGQYTGLSLGLAFGGVDYEKQRRTLEAGVDILIGTPGRIIDYYKQHVFDLKHVQVMVLDEADRMFDLGFIADIRYLMRRLPEPSARLSMLFSATLSQRVLELAYEHMNEPELVRIEPEKVTADRVRQTIYYPAMDEKARLLIGLLRKHSATRTIVFVNMKRTAERLEATLRANNIDAEAMSGDVPQNKRLRMLRDFHEGRLPVLIATDVAARGLHIPDVSHVFNYDLPQDAEDYVHRIGRTARAGAAGDAISFGCEDYVQSLPDIEAYIGRKLPVEAVEPDVLAEIVLPPRSEYERARGGGPRGRGGPGGRSDGGPRSGSGGGPRGRGGPSRGPRPERRPDSGPHAADAVVGANASGPPAASQPTRPPRDESSAPRPAGAADAVAPAAEGAQAGAPRKRRRRGGRGRGRKATHAVVETAEVTTSSAAPSPRAGRWAIVGAAVAGAAALVWYALHAL
jgi:ATP-dependent RNA helicase RhlB